MTRPLVFPEHPTDPVTERRIDNLEKRSLTQQAIDGSDVSLDNVAEYAWGVDGPVGAGISTPKPIWTQSSLVAFYAVIMSTTTTATVFELRHNGIALVLGLTLAAGTDVDGIVYIGEGFAPGDDYEIAITSAGAGAEDLQTWSLFGS